MDEDDRDAASLVGMQQDEPPARQAVDERAAQLAATSNQYLDAARHYSESGRGEELADLRRNLNDAPEHVRAFFLAQALGSKELHTAAYKVLREARDVDLSE